jgi:hypothetical protein
MVARMDVRVALNLLVSELSVVRPPELGIVCPSPTVAADGASSSTAAAASAFLLTARRSRRTRGPTALRARQRPRAAQCRGGAARGRSFCR